MHRLYQNFDVEVSGCKKKKEIQMQGLTWIFFSLWLKSSYFWQKVREKINAGHASFVFRWEKNLSECYKPLSYTIVALTKGDAIASEIFTLFPDPINNYFIINGSVQKIIFNVIFKYG